MRTSLTRLLALLLSTATVASADPGSTRFGDGPGRDRAGRAVVERIAWETFEGRARLVVGVRGAVDYTTRAAGADAAANLPHRAYVDLRPAVLAKDLMRAPLPVDDALAQRVRVGQFDPETVRIVVDLSGPGMFEVRTSERPPRLLLGIAPRPPRESAPAARAAAPAAAPVATADEPPIAAPLPSPSASVQVVARLPEPTPLPAETRAPRTPEPTAPPVVTAPPAASAAPPKATVAMPETTPGAEPAVVAADGLRRARPAEAAAERKAVPAGELASSSASVAEAPAPPPAERKPAQKGAQKAAGKPARTPAPQTWTVVLDPGHGGRDPGARGVTGDEEKEITLAVAQMIAERLQENPQIRVVLTRTDDSYVSLEQRTAIANAQGADLFVSIHANASENPQLAGVETYTLNNTDDRATIRLAALENGLALTGAAPGERDLAYILSDLVQTGKEDESVTLARAVQGNLVSYLRDRWRGVSNLGVKKGPFYVLVGAYMPCILVEVAFLTNETEGQRIAARRYQEDVAEGIASGIRRFLSSDTANANL